MLPFIKSFTRKAPSFVLLFTSFSIAYYFTPYWAIPENRRVSLALMTMTLLVGALWAMLSAGQPQFKLKPVSWLLFTGAIVVTILFNFLPLTQSIAWKGDESHHINHVVRLVTSLPPAFIIGLVLLPLSMPVLVRARPGIGLAMWLLILIALLYAFRYESALRDMDGYFLARYPFFLYWLAALPSSLAMTVTHPFHEWLYRLLPLSSTAMLAWLFVKDLKPERLLMSALMITALVSIPNLFYYSTLFYLELPSVVLMFLVLKQLDTVLESTPETLRNRPIWLALLLLGFIKETNLLFLLLILVLRLAWLPRTLNREGARHRLSPTLIMAELGLASSILFPVLFYLFLRGYLLGDIRSYGAAFGNLLAPETYLVLVKALWAQYGLLLLIAIIGLIGMGRQNHRRLAASLGFLLIVTVAFNITDSKLFIGYSRFNLNVLPILLIAAGHALRELQRCASRWLLPLLFFWLISNLLLTPFHIDGSRKSGWGSYNTDTSEYAYPYDQVFAAIMDRDEVVNILMTGLNYGYDYEFYLKKNELTAAVDLDDSAAPTPETLPAFIDESKGIYDYIIYHYMRPGAPAHISELSDYRSKTFCNMAQCLTLYERTQ